MCIRRSRQLVDLRGEERSDEILMENKLCRCLPRDWRRKFCTRRISIAAEQRARKRLNSARASRVFAASAHFSYV